MYSTCLFCRAALGANDQLEHFPVGRRIAFDSARGRLWVVCASCKQWCLSPLEERWEAVEEAERLYRGTRLRAATDQIGLARLRDGSELVRIGEPLRPEFAAWRYGARFGARWRRRAAIVAGTTALVGGYIVVGPVMGLIAAGGWIPWNLTRAGLSFVRRRRVTARLDVAGGPVAMTDEHLTHARLVSDPRAGEGWQLWVPHVREDLQVGRFTLHRTRDSDPLITLKGAEALSGARAILPRLNRWGGRTRAVNDAVQFLEEVGSPSAGFTTLSDFKEDGSPTDLRTLPQAMRLALEMAAHEETERRALEGELSALEDAWRDAEEVAAIADSLTLPERIGAELERLRR